jgi:hypothetical protein
MFMLKLLKRCPGVKTRRPIFLTGSHCKLRPNTEGLSAGTDDLMAHGHNATEKPKSHLTMAPAFPTAPEVDIEALEWFVRVLLSVAVTPFPVGLFDYLICLVTGV